MPLHEIEEDQLRTLQSARALLGKLYADPKYGHTFKQLLKAHNPNLSIPEIDAAAPVIARMQDNDKRSTEAITKLAERFDKYLEDQRTEREDSDLKGKLDRVRTDFELTDEGMERLKKTMVDRNIADPEAAAALLTRQQAPAAPAAPSSFKPSRWNLTRETDESSKQLIADPEAWMEDEASRVWDEVSQTAA